MKVSRRSFLKYCIASAATIGLDLSVVKLLEKALAAAEAPPVLWLNGANCTGCTVSLANVVAHAGALDVGDLLINTINLTFHPNLMGAAGDLAVTTLFDAAQAGGYILAVDGGIPTAFDGHTCIVWTDPRTGMEVTALEAVTELAGGAAAVLCIGTCASFGGIPAGNPNPTSIRSVREIIGGSTINIPGCPPHPDWMVWTFAQLLAGLSPKLDSSGRPKELFSGKSGVHKKCPRKEVDGKAATFGTDGLCLKKLGCRGPECKADCSTRLWNNGTNWCVGANAICLACTENGFPDKFSPFYRD
ncbi:hydrogenase small subunit [Desulfoferrobacter suflitae]|uniref:hydrogenase small subunit n=1 Tax=Desulfoferrobacter suflitae TaxID=2865782 RepID=UPI002164B3DC|nr:hydrogenase small subunit [Desulfoferrobacter suflitae]MCK8601708.1 hydrogenase small subunit [Desulfoferrobacter suflitae]